MGISTPPADVGDVRSEDAGVTDDGNLPYPSIYNGKSVLLNSLKHFMRKKNLVSTDGKNTEKRGWESVVLSLTMSIRYCYLSQTSLRCVFLGKVIIHDVFHLSTIHELIQCLLWY